MARKKKDETEVADGDVEFLDPADFVDADNTDTEADALEAAIDAAEDEIGEYSAEDYGWMGVKPVEAMADHEAESSREAMYKKALNDVLKLTSGTLDHRFVNINRVASEALRGG